MTDRLGSLMLAAVLGMALLFSGYLAGTLVERTRCRPPGACAGAARAADSTAPVTVSNPMRATRPSAQAWLP